MNLTLVLFVVIGAVLYIGFSLNEVLNKPDFQWKIYLKENWLVSVLNILCGVTLIFLRDDIAQWLPMTKIVAVFVGFSGQGIIKRIFKVLDGKVDTFIGYNEK
jgi:hypothetical protein